jgi:nitrogen fixation protein NifU and related proteins
MVSDDLYQELILDHYRNPRWNSVLSPADQSIELRNPLCGDRLTLSVNFQEERIAEIGFEGQGCSISQATASIMAELLKGKTIQEAKQLAGTYRGMMRGEISEKDLGSLGDAVALEGVRKYSARIKCALLAWDCIERILEKESGVDSDLIGHSDQSSRVVSDR